MPTLIEDAVALKKGKLKPEDIRDGRRKIVQQLADSLGTEGVTSSVPVKRAATTRGTFINKVKAS